MSEDKIKQLEFILQVHKYDTKITNTVEIVLDNLNNYIQTLENGEIPSNESYKNCLACLQYLNVLCEKSGAPILFTKLNELSKSEIIREYIIEIATQIEKIIGVPGSIYHITNIIKNSLARAGYKTLNINADPIIVRHINADIADNNFEITITKMPV